MSAYAPRTRECLAAVVVSAGEHFQTKERLKPWLAKAPGLANTADGQLAVYSYLGDVALRFVFTAADCMESPARVEDLQRLDLTPERALALASLNFKRLHGPAQPGLVTKGVYTMRGGNPDVYCGYLLDRAYWRSQLERSAPGVLLAMPKRGSLFFAYAADAVASQELRSMAARLYRAADEHGLSNCIYRFDAHGWHVHERLPQDQGEPAPGAAPRLQQGAARDSARDAEVLAQRAAERAQEDHEERLSLAAKGQKMVIYCVLLNLLLGGMERGNALPLMAQLAAAVAVAIYALVGVVRMCSGLEKSQNQKIAFMVFAFIPLVNVLALVQLSRQFSKTLKKAGWTVGLMGATP